MSFEIQVQVDRVVTCPCGCGQKTKKLWESVRPTGGTPYRFDTIREASKIATMCYGSTSLPFRIVKAGQK